VLILTEESDSGISGKDKINVYHRAVTTYMYNLLRSDTANDIVLKGAVTSLDILPGIGV